MTNPPAETKPEQHPPEQERARELAEDWTAVGDAVAITLENLREMGHAYLALLAAYEDRSAKNRELHRRAQAAESALAQGTPERVQALEAQLAEANVAKHKYRNENAFMKSERRRLKARIRTLVNDYEDRSKAFERAAADCVRLEGERDGANAAAVDYEAWLGAALRALGVKTIFDIPDYKTHLQAAIKDQEREHAEARQALQPRHRNSGGDQDPDSEDEQHARAGHLLEAREVEQHQEEKHGE